LNALNDRQLNYVQKSKLHNHLNAHYFIEDKNAVPIKIKSTYKPFNIRELDAGKIIYNEEYIK
jgi:hypothetical protein